MTACYFTVLILHIRLHLRWAFSILFNTVNSKALHDATSKLVFNVYRLLCDFTIILDYYYRLIYERNNNSWWNNLAMKMKKSDWIPKIQKNLFYLKRYASIQIAILLKKILWPLEFSSLDSFNQLNLKIIYHSSIFDKSHLNFNYQ